ncbi:hypothetical protein [Micromonospora sp. URMC 103]
MPGYRALDAVLAAPKATPGPLWVGIIFAVVVVVGLPCVLYLIRCYRP